MFFVLPHQDLCIPTGTTPSRQRDTCKCAQQWIVNYEKVLSY